MKDINVAYGSLDYAHGERVNKAILHIQTLGDIKPKSWFYDIIHTPNQRPAATVARIEIEEHIRKLHPTLTDHDVAIRLTTDKDNLPAKNFMLAVMRLNKPKDVNFLKPTR